MSRVFNIRLTDEVSRQLKKQSDLTGISQAKLLQEAYLNQNVLKKNVSMAFSCCCANFSNRVDTWMCQILQVDVLSPGIAYKKLNRLLRTAVGVKFCQEYLKRNESSLFNYWVFCSQNGFSVLDVIPKDFVQKCDAYLDAWSRVVDECVDNNFGTRLVTKMLDSDIDRLRGLLLIHDDELMDWLTRFCQGVKQYKADLHIN